jgi:hypothetical protein
MPAVWSATDRGMLEVSARLAYCPKCWDDDAAHGMAPYIRRVWVRWTSVSCRRHKDWLAARRPATVPGSAPIGWAVIWQSEPRWAEAAGLRYEPRGQELAPAFVPGSFRRPAASWEDFELQLATLASADGRSGRYGTTAGSILGVVVRPELLGLRVKVLRALQIGAAGPLVSDLDLRGYSRSEPCWIAARIACLVTAIELTGLATNSRSAMPSVRAIVEATPWRKWLSPDASEFLSELRDRARHDPGPVARSQEFRQ